MRLTAACILLSGALLLGGCIKTQPADAPDVTKVDPKYAQPSYWYSQPPSVTVAYPDFQTLWDACEATARGWFFRIERRDYREGLLATEPTISKQFWEFWRKDAGTAFDNREATLGNIRRTIRFQFTREADGSYTVAPKVLVERYSMWDMKYYTDPTLPAQYWYALRRDTVMEGRLANAIRDRLKSAQAVAAKESGGEDRR